MCPNSSLDRFGQVQIATDIWFIIFGVVLGLTIALIAARVIIDTLDYETQNLRRYQGKRLPQVRAEEPHTHQQGQCCGECYTKLLLQKARLRPHLEREQAGKEAAQASREHEGEHSALLRYTAQEHVLT